MFIRLFLILCLALFFASCEDKESSQDNTPVQSSELEKSQDTVQNDTAKEKNEENTTQESKPMGPLVVQEDLIPFLTEFGEENPEDRIRIKTRFGNIEVQLFHDTPLHRANFIFLVKNEYFNDTFFHRVHNNFVIQGGNSDNRSTNQKRHYIGSYLIPSEFEAGHRHVRGSFSAAKYSEQNVSKASSPYEFFIVQAANGAPHLDNDHTVFGRVTKGMEVVDKIASVDTDESEWPLSNIYLSVEIID